MGTFIVFILKSTCCLAVFYLFYRLLLSRDTFHRFNRMALLGVIAFSIAIPFVRMVADGPAGVQPAMPDAGQLLQMPGMSVPETADGGNLSVCLRMPLFCRAVPVFHQPDRAPDPFGRDGRPRRRDAACRGGADGPAVQLDEIYRRLADRYGEERGGDPGA